MVGSVAPTTREVPAPTGLILRSRTMRLLTVVCVAPVSIRTLPIVRGEFLSFTLAMNNAVNVASLFETEPMWSARDAAGDEDDFLGRRDFLREDRPVGEPLPALVDGLELRVEHAEHLLADDEDELPLGAM